jgi:hypothetical protein
MVNRAEWTVIDRGQISQPVDAEVVTVALISINAGATTPA